MRKLNETQQKILDFAKKNNIFSMTLTEIKNGLERDFNYKIDHLFKIKYHLEQLRKKNLIYMDPSQKKEKVAELKGFAVDNLISVPIVGSANCGPALEIASEQIRGYLKISRNVLTFSSPENLIAVQAVGDSLNKASIKGDNVEDGDYLIVDCKKIPDDEDYVLSIIDGAANFKKLYKDKKRKEIRLVSESTLNIAPIILHQDDLGPMGYFVNGVVIRVVKN